MCELVLTLNKQAPVKGDFMFYLLCSKLVSNDALAELERGYNTAFNQFKDLENFIGAFEITDSNNLNGPLAITYPEYYGKLRICINPRTFNLSRNTKGIVPSESVIYHELIHVTQSMIAYSKDIKNLIKYLFLKQDVVKQYGLWLELIKKNQKTFLDSIGVNLNNIPADLKNDLAQRQELNEDIFYCEFIPYLFDRLYFLGQYQKPNLGLSMENARIEWEESRLRRLHPWMSDVAKKYIEYVNSTSKILPKILIKLKVLLMNLRIKKEKLKLK